jgi:probable addiction module antidote protein
MIIPLVPFDMSAILDSEEAMTEYVRQVLEDGEMDEMLRAVGYIAKSRGMAQVAKDSGLGRESLYKALRPGAQPKFETISKVLKAIGFRLSVEPLKRGSAAV